MLNQIGWHLGSLIMAARTTPNGWLFCWLIDFESSIFRFCMCWFDKYSSTHKHMCIVDVGELLPIYQCYWIHLIPKQIFENDGVNESTIHSKPIHISSAVGTSATHAETFVDRRMKRIQSGNRIELRASNPFTVTTGVSPHDYIDLWAGAFNLILRRELNKENITVFSVIVL